MTSSTTRNKLFDSNGSETLTVEEAEYLATIVCDHPPCWARKPRVTCIPRRHKMNPARECRRFQEFMLPDDEFDFPSLGALNAQRLLSAQRVIVAAMRNSLDPKAAAMSLAREVRRYPFSQFAFEELDATMMLADLRALARSKAA